MPIVGEGANARIEYTIPDNILQMIAHGFLKSFRDELFKIYDLSLDTFYLEGLAYIEGTSGWDVAFGLACKKKRFKFTL